MKKLIGLTGFARSGKDTFYDFAGAFISGRGDCGVRMAFADVLKEECDGLTLPHAGISSFTTVPHEKELIRPLLVAYGTHLRRRLNPNCWIDKIRAPVNQSLENGKYVFITDVRFENEAQWIKSEGGALVTIVRQGVGPANPDEEEQFPLILPLVDFSVEWPTYGAENIDQCAPIVNSTMRDIEKFFQTITPSQWTIDERESAAKVH